MPRFHAPKLFVGAAAVGPQGVMQQADVVLVAAARRRTERAERVVLLVDSNKLASSSGAIGCGLDEVDLLIPNAGIPVALRGALAAAGVQPIVAE